MVSIRPNLRESEMYLQANLSHSEAFRKNFFNLTQCEMALDQFESIRINQNQVFYPTQSETFRPRIQTRLRQK